MTKTPRAIYIMSRGHSGSTFLDVMLGTAPGVESIGEVVSGLNRGHAEICSCTKTAGECEYWQQVAAIYKERTGGRDLFEDGSWLWRKSDVRNFPKVLFANPDKPDTEWNDYKIRNAALFGAVADVSGADAVLDSNKEFSRGLMLLKTDPKAKVLHLHRSPMAIIGSHYYRRKEKGLPFKFLKREYTPEAMFYPAMMLTALAWTVAMGLGTLMKVMYPKRVLHVRYESLVGDPENEIKRIGEFLEIDTSEIIRKAVEREPFMIGHNLGGNELRHDGSFTFVPNVKGRRKLPAIYKIGASIFAAPGYLMRAFTA